MNKKLILAAMVSASLSSVGTLAVADNGINYNYLEGRFIIDADFDGFGDGDGFGFGGSYRLDELLYVIGDYETIDFDIPFFGDIDASTLQVGLGAIFPYDKVDVVAEAALVNVDSDFAGYDDTGVRLSGGVRGYLQPNIELRGMLNYVDIDDADDTFITIAADYFVNDSLSIGLSKDLSADVDRFSIGVRYYLGE